MSKAYKIIKYKYDSGRITAAEVWDAADRGEITAEEAAKICGPRPRE